MSKVLDYNGLEHYDEKIKEVISEKSEVSVSDTGTATDEVSYITIDGVEKKLAGGGGGGSSYTFTNGLTESSGTVSWDLNNNVYASPYGSVYIGNSKPASLQDNTVAIGTSPHASSMQTIAISTEGSQASYYKDIAIGYSVSTAHGSSTGRNYKQGQIVIGNKSRADGNQFFILADGDNHPSSPNVLTVNWDGYLKCTGFTDGSTSKTMGQILAGGGGGGGGSSYTFTDGLTNSNDVVSWDLYNKIRYINSNNNNGFHIGEGNTLDIANAEQVIAFGGNHSAGDIYATNKHYRILLAGENNTVAGSCSSAFGGNLKLNGGYATAIGTSNIEDAHTGSWDKGDYVFIIGNGTSDSSRSNAYTLDWQGNAAFAGTVSSVGADYAEYFEWLNVPNGRMIGYLVTLEGDKIKLADGDDDVLGITSGTATILGDDAEWYWHKRYLQDEFGCFIYEDYDVEHPAEVDPTTGEIIIPAYTEHVHTRKQNPEWNPDEPYERRADRLEWQAVGMMGKLFVRDDGTSVVGGYIKPSNGIATASTERTNMRVIERINDHVIKVVLK